MSRKGPDGRTLPVGDATQPTGATSPDDAEGSTQRMARRSIRDRIASVDQGPEAETRAVHRPADTNRTTPIEGGGDDPSGYEETRLTDSPGKSGRTPAGVGGSQTEPMAAAAGSAGDDPTGPGSGAAGTPGDVPGGVSTGAGQAGSGPAPAAVQPAAPPAEAAAAPSQTNPDVTQVYRPNRGRDGGSADAGAPGDDPTLDGDDMTSDGLVPDPVVGWLVVIEGPGRGTALAIGYGNNRVGRDPAKTSCLTLAMGRFRVKTMRSSPTTVKTAASISSRAQGAT